ncbi:MAG TPA: BON domain-containing protein [Isosphaeraceae bacterium]|nr:BON domain-containing protein [Isosphaeraceae bacterium]
MKPRRLALPSSIALALLACGQNVAFGQTVPRPAGQNQKPDNAQRPAPQTPVGQTAARLDAVVLAAIRSNPMTAAYPISTNLQKGKVVLSGIVGTKQVHDAAVRMVIDMGIPFRDDLVIDTGAAGAVALSAGAAVGGYGGAMPGTLSNSSPYIYPPPLFARLDDPFFGFVPPLVSFPPWWRRAGQGGPTVQPRKDPAALPQASPAVATDSSRPSASPKGSWQPMEVDPVKGQVEISVDELGGVFLRGIVASEQAGREIEDAARSVPGVTAVTSQFQTVPRRVQADEAPPPAPPVPMPGPSASEEREPQPSSAAAPAIVPSRPKPTAAAPLALDAQPLTRRIVGALERRSQVGELPVKVRSTDGVVTLSGRVPSAYEAMLVYRAAQQTPGVTDIIDRLEFTVPDENHANPLLQKGRPEDIEPYLASQIRRHVGDLAHVDRIQVRGDSIDLRGTLQNAGDLDRLLAILRSIPLLHGFRLETDFKAD